MNVNDTRPPGRSATGGAPGTGHRPTPMLWFLLLFAAGETLLGGIDRIHHLGATVGIACFIAIPLLAAAAASAWLPHR